MRNLNEGNITDAVIQQIKAENPRLQEVMAALIRHLHAFVQEVELTEGEWFKAIEFLTRTGQMCTDDRQEFILLSDTLGLSILVDAINHRMPEGATESTVLGPFHRDGVPMLEHGANIAQGAQAEKGDPVVVRGRIRDVSGKPIAGALLDIWQASPDGKYDVQEPDQLDMNLRGKFVTDANGEYWFRSVKPSAYPIPDDGPVGDLLRVTGRHPMRPAHIHFMITAQGYESLITHIFVEGDEYLDSDAVFGVKNSLVTEFILNESKEAAAAYGFNQPAC